jgi:hypothetical protein
MKNMKTGKKSEFFNSSKSIFEKEKDLKEQAKELAKKHKDVKPIKYLLSNGLHKRNVQR